MIDSHCHLNFDSFDGRREELVSSAKHAGVDTIINIGIDLETSRECIALAARFDGLYATVGIHPHDAAKAPSDYIEKMRELASREKVLALGEMGLDYYRDLSPRATQRKVFRKQLELACEMNLPVVIHSRESLDECIDIVAEFVPSLKGGVFHCFPGSTEDARRVIDLGLIISVGGVITFKNSRMSKVASEVPLDRLILETDAPFLTPVPHRGKTNLPEYAAIVYRRLAELRDEPLSEVERLVDGTCRKFFGLVETFGG